MRGILRLTAVIVLASAPASAQPQEPTGTPEWRAGAPITLFTGASLDQWVAERISGDSDTSPRLVADTPPDIVDGAIRLMPRFGWIRTKAVQRNFRLEFAYNGRDNSTVSVYFRTWPRLDKYGKPVNGYAVTLRAPNAEWHQVVVECGDKRAEIFVNGQVVATDTAVRNPVGYIGLRAETGEVDIREIILTPLNKTVVTKLAGFRATKDDGVELPRLVREVKPKYTAEAMRERIEGAVWMEAVVKEDGSVGDIEVVQSLDPIYGLDDQALGALKKWRFQPGRRDGEPVPVVVTVEMTFTLK